MRQTLSTELVLVLTAVLVCSACGDDSSTGPTEGEFLLDPRTQWSGGVVEATSALFSDATTWAVLVDGDTVSSWRVDPSAIAFQLPNPYLSGTATVDVEVSGAELLPSTVDVVGNTWPVRVLECPASDPCTVPRLQWWYHYFHGTRLPGGQLMAFFETSPGSPGGGGFGLGVLDGAGPVINWIPDLSADQMPGLVAPGPTPSGREWIFDVSPPGLAAQPTVWDLGQAPRPVRPLACLPHGIAGGYEIAELPSGDCLVLTDPGDLMAGALTLNGTTPIAGYGEIPYGWMAGCATIRTSSENNWSTLRSLRGDLFCDIAMPPVGLPDWSVLDATGSIAFSTPRYPEWVRGADFTAEGDTLWVVGSTPSWSLDAWNPASGELIREIALEGIVQCEDVLVDPLRPYVYAACRLEDGAPSYAPWPSLVVVDRNSGATLAVLDAVLPSSTLPFLPPVELSTGGSSGRVHLTGVWDGTSAPVERGVFVISWDILD